VVALMTVALPLPAAVVVTLPPWSSL